MYKMNYYLQSYKLQYTKSVTSIRTKFALYDIITVIFLFVNVNITYVNIQFKREKDKGDSID